MNLSLNRKLIVMMIFLSFIMSSILLVLYLQAEKGMLKEYEGQIIELSKAIQVGVEEITSQGSTDEMRLYQYLQNLHTKGVKEISIISNADQVIASTNLTKVGKPVGEKKKELIIKAELGESLSRDEGKVSNVILPVIAGKEHYGYIHLKINTEDFSKLMRINMVKRVVVTLLVFGVGIVIAMFLSWKYTQPIHNVVNAAKRIAAGDLQQNIDSKRKDEIGELTDSFNFMAQKLREQRKIEERLREAEHLSGIGQLSQSIAHEIRNPLNFISLSIDHIKEKYSPSGDNTAEKFDSLIRSIKQEIQRLNKLVEDFLDYGKPLRLNRSSTDINILLEDIMEIIWAKADAEKITVEKNLAHQLPLVNIDPELIKTCIFNVILNAFQTMPHGGKITIQTQSSDTSVSILVSDTGAGVSAKNIERVFEPFFTTKKDGLGLGLSMTKRVVEEHGGIVNFLSTEGKGTNVIIALPLGHTKDKVHAAA